MLKFELNIADRKTLANRMEELTGIHILEIGVNMT